MNSYVHRFISANHHLFYLYSSSSSSASSLLAERQNHASEHKRIFKSNKITQKLSPLQEPHPSNHRPVPNSTKFREKIEIPRKWVKNCTAWLKIPHSMENCGLLTLTLNTTFTLTLTEPDPNLLLALTNPNFKYRLSVLQYL